MDKNRWNIMLCNEIKYHTKWARCSKDLWFISYFLNDEVKVIEFFLPVLARSCRLLICYIKQLQEMLELLVRTRRNNKKLFVRFIIKSILVVLSAYHCLPLHYFAYLILKLLILLPLKRYNHIKLIQNIKALFKIHNN